VSCHVEFGLLRLLAEDPDKNLGDSIQSSTLYESIWDMEYERNGQRHNDTKGSDVLSEEYSTKPGCPKTCYVPVPV